MESDGRNEMTSKASTVSFREGTYRDATGTCLVDEITATYDDLERVFGAPYDRANDPDGDGKVKAEWILIFGGEVVATIYDWKTDLDPEDVTCWHIGGRSILAAKLVKEALAA